MKKILTSLLVISAVSVFAVQGTKSYFTDTETAANNTFSTGTIDISVDDQNPWSQSYTISDMKPGYVDYINFTVENVGSNPANIWKDINVTAYNNSPVSEPECQAETGTWTPDPTNQYLGTCSGNTAVTDLESVINYDLNVKVYDTAGVMAWEQVLYKEDITLANAYAADKKLYLGMLPAGWTMAVAQSYRMDKEAGNAYQGDSITFDIVLSAEQLINSLTLENKTADWQVLADDSTYATLSYGAKESQFNYTLAVSGMTDGAYTLVAWEDSAHTWTWGSFAGTTSLANLTVAGGVANVTGSIDLGKDLTNAKIWLVPGTYTAGATGFSLPWNTAQTLFETGLVDYYDSDL